MNRKQYLKNIYDVAAKKWKKQAKEKIKYGDYSIIEYVGKTDLEKYKIPLHRVKIRCKCGFEKIVPTNSLNTRDFKCSHHGSFPSNELLFNSWYSMNRCCSLFLSKNEESNCIKNNIQVFYPWRILEDKKESADIQTLYKRYETFVLHLLKFSNWDIKDLEKKRIRVLRIDKNQNFVPQNLKLFHLNSKKSFIPSESQLDKLILEQNKLIDFEEKEKMIKCLI